MKKNYSAKTYHRSFQSLSHALDIITKPVFLKRGFAENRIITDWNKIVGDAMGSCTVPKKLTFMREQKSNGTLYIEVGNSSFATEIVYMEPMILEKIACYFGYKAVSRLKILQNPKNIQSLGNKPVVVKKITENKKHNLELLLAGIDDEELKQSLRQLGEGVMAE